MPVGARILELPRGELKQQSLGEAGDAKYLQGPHLALPKVKPHVDLHASLGQAVFRARCTAVQRPDSHAQFPPKWGRPRGRRAPAERGAHHHASTVAAGANDRHVGKKINP